MLPATWMITGDLHRRIIEVSGRQALRGLRLDVDDDGVLRWVNVAREQRERTARIRRLTT